jgi:pimeloyl-ACP methyl ester carboxylesterase
VSGLYCFEPPDPHRIPVIFIHGLLCTSFMWLDVINDMNSDPVLRARYQAFVYRYPTGFPLEVNALNLRRELTRLQSIESMPEGMVVVGHSMGGLLARMQVVTTHRELWDASLASVSSDPPGLYKKTPNDCALKAALCFEANPKVRRLIFICVPHRGSDFADGGIAAFGNWLIRLRGWVTPAASTDWAESSRCVPTEHKFHFPTSIDELSPKNPTLRVLNRLPFHVPHHSIIGEEVPDSDLETSSDGFVPYWSSHLDTAQSELIVHGGHTVYAQWETRREVLRILRLHLGEGE